MQNLALGNALSLSSTEPGTPTEMAVHLKKTPIRGIKARQRPTAHSVSTQNIS